MRMVETNLKSPPNSANEPF